MRVYATVCSKSTYIRSYCRKTHVYTRLWKQNPRTGRKRDKKKENRQAETKFTPVRHYWANMPPDPTQKQRNQSNLSTFNAEKPPKKTTRNLPSMVANSVTEKLPMAWGVPQQTEKPKKSIPSQYAREIKHLTLKDLESYLIPDG